MRRLFFAFVALCLLGWAARAQNDYPLTPDSERQSGVPQGVVTPFKHVSKIFPGAERDGWIYVPKQYDPKTPACVMVFQDGGGFQDTGGGFRVPIVFDNLIARGEMPVTIGIFLNPGVLTAKKPGALPRYNRSFEYDSPTETYARFLIDEILPEVGKTYNLTSDPNGRAICGASSGGICAFNVAWQRPEAFRRVISFIGSFTDLRGGHNFGPWIRKTEPKPLKIFLQDGVNDQDIYSGNWFIGNTDVQAALKFARYDFQWLTGNGGHDGVQARAVLPDALRWLWKGYPAPIEVARETPQPVTRLVTPGEPWQSVPLPEGTRAQALTTGPDGDIYVFDASQKRLLRLFGAGGVALFAQRVPALAALAFAPDGRLVGAGPGGVVAWSASGQRMSLVSGIDATSVVVGATGELWAGARTSDGGALWYRGADGKARRVQGSSAPLSGVTLTPDQSLLLVSEPVPGPSIHSHQIQPDGSLAQDEAYHEAYAPYGTFASQTAGMATDTNGWLYVASAFGIQVLDQAGRVNSILLAPVGARVTALSFGGPSLDTLYATTADGKLYRRKTRAKGVLPFQPPITPPGPRL